MISIMHVFYMYAIVKGKHANTCQSKLLTHPNYKNKIAIA